ncbi:MAG: DNA polymerase III subunit delta [Clostridia bacterium]|nr:DNA polymerase III subunit delta [Clostridia bacterium]
MKVDELRARIAEGKTDGVYLFCGEEDFLKRHYLGELRRRLVPDEGIAPFVHFVYEGAEVDLGAILDAARAPTMFGDGKLVEWYGADFEHMKESALKALEAACEELKDEAGATVVFIASAEGLDTGTEKRPTRLFTRLSKCLNAVPFFRSTDAALIGWLRRHFAAEGVTVEQTLPAAMLARVGHNMDVLLGELDKLVAYAKENGISVVTEKELLHVCIRTVESDAFSFTNALLDGKREEAYLYLGDMKRRRVDPISVLGQISRLYADLFAVAALAADGVGEKEIAKTLGMHEYKASLYFRRAKAIGVDAIEEKLRLCGKIDADLKRGTSSYRGLEMLLATI